MEFTRALTLRQSTRAFTDEQLTEKEVAELLKAAMAAPTCMGRFERVHLTVVQDPAVLEELNQLFQKAVGDPNAYPSYHAPTLSMSPTPWRMRRSLPGPTPAASWRTCCSPPRT